MLFRQRVPNGEGLTPSFIRSPSFSFATCPIEVWGSSVPKVRARVERESKLEGGRFVLGRGHALTLVCKGSVRSWYLRIAKGQWGLRPLYHVGVPLPSGDFNAQLCGGEGLGSGPVPRSESHCGEGGNCPPLPSPALPDPLPHCRVWVRRCGHLCGMRGWGGDGDSRYSSRLTLTSAPRIAAPSRQLLTCSPLPRQRPMLKRQLLERGPRQVHGLRFLSSATTQRLLPGM